MKSAVLKYAARVLFWSVCFAFGCLVGHAGHRLFLDDATGRAAGSPSCPCACCDPCECDPCKCGEKFKQCCGSCTCVASEKAETKFSQQAREHGVNRKEGGK